MRAYKLKKYLCWLPLLFVFSCSEGLEDLFFDNYPELSEMAISETSVAPFDTVWASIEATNPIEGPLEYQWSVSPQLGNFIGVTDLDSIRWIAPYAGGIYELTVEVSNSKRTSPASKQVEVITSDIPYVKILSPDAGTYFVIGQTFAVEARAEHANGLSWVRLWVGDSLIQQLDQNGSGIYQFSCTADSSMVGNAGIKVESKANYGTTPGSDMITVQIGGMILGKNGK